MKAFTLVLIASSVGILSLGSCQPHTRIQNPSLVTKDRLLEDGFSKPELSVMNSIEVEGASSNNPPLTSERYLSFHLRFSVPRLVKSWRVEWVAQNGTIVYSVSGSQLAMVRTLLWDGRSPSGQRVPPGIYAANLTVDYGNFGGLKSARSTPFQLKPSSPTSAATDETLDVDDPELIEGLPFERLE